MPVTSDPVLDPEVVLGAVLIESGDLRITRREVLRWAQRFDPTFAARARRRAAIGAQEDDPASEADVEATAAEFRYERGLESVESLKRWLAERGLSVDSWWEVMRRDASEQRLTGVTVPDASGEDDEEGRLGDLALSDLLAEPVRALARRIAVARETVGWEPAPSDAVSDATFDQRHDALEAIWRSWRDPLMTETALEGAVDRDRMSWVVLDLLETSWPSQDAAREAVSCVRYDGMALPEVAEAARVPPRESSRLVADLPGPLRDALLSAVPGDLVGPVEIPPRWSVVLVRGKRAPSLDQALVRAAAERAVESRGAQPLVARHISRREASA